MTSVHFPQIAFAGALAAHVSVTMEADDYVMSMFGAPWRSTLPMQRSATLEMELVVSEPDFFPLDFGGQLMTLGPGWLCKGCGDFNPTGTMMCYRCGSPAKRIPFIHPYVTPWMMSRYAWRHSLHDPNILWDEETKASLEAPMIFSLEFVSTGALITPDDYFWRDPYQLASAPLAWRQDQGYFLCKYCGMAVPEGQECSGCGGPRSPWQELMELDRTCIFCGTGVRGGITCPSCGARIRGTTYKKLMERL